MIFLSVSLCVFLSRLRHDFLSVSSYGFFLCVGFYPWSDSEVTLQVWTVSYSTWLSEGISITDVSYAKWLCVLSMTILDMIELLKPVLLIETSISVD